MSNEGLKDLKNTIDRLVELCEKHPNKLNVNVDNTRVEADLSALEEACYVRDCRKLETAFKSIMEYERSNRVIVSVCTEIILELSHQEDNPKKCIQQIIDFLKKE